VGNFKNFYSDGDEVKIKTDKRQINKNKRVKVKNFLKNIQMESIDEIDDDELNEMLDEY